MSVKLKIHTKWLVGLWKRIVGCLNPSTFSDKLWESGQSVSCQPLIAGTNCELSAHSELETSGRICRFTKWAKVEVRGDGLRGGGPNSLQDARLKSGCCRERLVDILIQGEFISFPGFGLLDWWFTATFPLSNHKSLTHKNGLPREEEKITPRPIKPKQTSNVNPPMGGVPLQK